MLNLKANKSNLKFHMYDPQCSFVVLVVHLSGLLAIVSVREMLVYHREMSGWFVLIHAVQTITIQLYVCAKLFTQ